MVTKKENTIKCYWPKAVQMLCWGATCTNAQRDAYWASCAVEPADASEFLDDPDHRPASSSCAPLSA